MANISPPIFDLRAERLCGPVEVEQDPAAVGLRLVCVVVSAVDQTRKDLARGADDLRAAAVARPQDLVSPGLREGRGQGGDS